MRRSEAARYARWSAAVALLLACITIGVYAKRSVRAWIDKRAAPPPAPVNVERFSSGLTFSKMEGPRKIFTVEASKATDFKDKAASLLEDVKITIFGKTGKRHDTMHTRSCQYGKRDGSIVCSGDVQMDLQSAANAERVAKNPASAAAQTVHVETRGVTFDRGSGEAQTDQPVKFAFPDGSGEAVGVEYNSEEGVLHLQREVRLRLKQPAGKGAGKKPGKTGPEEEVQVRGGSLDFGRDTRTMHLLGPAEAETRRARLTAGELTLSLDAAFRAQTLVGSAGAIGKRPELTLRSAREEMGMSADTLTAQFAPEGYLAKLDAAGSVGGSRHGSKEEDEFHADAASLDLWPRVSQAKELNLNGSVVLRTHASKSDDARILQTSALRMEFSEGKEGEASRATRAETLAAGTMEWTDAAPAGSAPTHTKLQADKLALDFGPQGKPQQLQATGSVQTERTQAGKPVQTATAKSGMAQLLASGGWSQMDLQGEVRLKEGERYAQADHAVFVRAAQTASLTGHAVARDAATETHAPRITFAGATGEIRAEGGVRSTDLSPKGSGVQLAPAPANITSDTMQANSKTGRALYTGHARLWQGDSVLEAESIELLRESKVLNAAGNVRAVFPQTPAQPAMLQAAPKKPNLWHVTAGALTYKETENQAHLEKNVVVQSAQQRIKAPALDLYFTRGGPGVNTAPNGAAANGGAQQISRAVGTGGVIVEEGTRRATAERGEYTAADGKFVMSGGNPTLYDASEGTTTGRQLTFFLASDTIIVDSEIGSRTLTKHRVEK